MRNIIMETLARAEYADPALRNAKQLGARQYVDFNTHLAPFRLKASEGMLRSRVFVSGGEQISQLEIRHFAKDKICFCNMLGFSYYTPIHKVKGVVSAFQKIFKEGSCIVFDLPDKIPFEETEKLLSDCGFLIYEYIMADEIQARFLDKYNTGSFVFKPLSDINFFMAVKKNEGE